MTHIHYSLELPKSGWSDQTDAYKALINNVNELLDKKEIESKSQAVIFIFELVYGALEYLETDALELAKSQKIINNPRIKSYEIQLSSIILLLEDICQEFPELATDRYVLYLEIIKKLLYVDLDGIGFFISIIEKIDNKTNFKKVPNSYFTDYVIFSLEIGIMSFEANNFTGALEIFQKMTNLVYEPTKSLTLDFQFRPFLALAITYETIGTYLEASNVYLELCNRIKVNFDSDNKVDIPLQFVHETMFYGYVCSCLSDKTDRLNYFYSLADYADQNVRELLKSIHSMAVFGFPILEAFNHLNVESIKKTINYYLGTSFVQSNQVNNSLGLRHLEPEFFLANIETQTKSKGVQKAILIVQTQHLKDIQVSIGKNNLPALNVLPDYDKGNFVVVDGIKFTIESQFAFGTSFSNEIELVVHYQKKLILKRKLSMNDRLPPFYLIDIDKELENVIALKEGAIRQFDVMWQKDMTLIDVIKAIALIDVSNLTFGSVNESKNFFKEFINLLKKLDLNEPERVISELAKQEATNMIMGKALKLVLIQRLSELEPNNQDIFNVIQEVAAS